MSERLEIPEPIDCPDCGDAIETVPIKCPSCGCPLWAGLLAGAFRPDLLSGTGGNADR